jgi:transcriptional regulator with XRE-family HTH domain
MKKEELVSIRNERCWTNKYLANMLGVSVQLVASYVTGYRKITPQKEQAIIHLYYKDIELKHEISNILRKR